MKTALTADSPCCSCESLEGGQLTVKGHQYLYMTSAEPGIVTNYECLLCLAKLSFDNGDKSWSLDWPFSQLAVTASL